jgi:hypothetical protein
MDIVPLLSEYLLRVLPGLVLGAAVLLLRPRRIVRVGVYLFFFILLRDAMTPVGLWSLGTEGFFWLRIAPSPAFLILFGILSTAAMVAVYALGYLAERRSRLVAGVGSGLAFAFCHVFLASTVTGTGIPLLAFTVWEGVIAGLVGAWFGVIPATLTHGGAIFLLASGLF